MMVGGLMGLLVGFPLLAVGWSRNKLGLGLGAFIVCVLCGAIGGLLLSVPVSAIGLIVILTVKRG